ncbi:TIGR00730 family Rossman fold protein [Evansella sp. AB-P1]|uniref:LOG family protein n=1 Tax=Evansella sp. AB-P1 TaxID=3037653 RepID=UPI00241C32C8|nr:TIGR00730 family Rossman fold protein [Evansella sp. AB-P1]MDG5788414.1 TIGR00730 family Rossman fold protein [Evansella sp. AB-P1]
MLSNLCVFCGSSFGNNLMYTNEAIKLGSLLPSRNIRLIYGGGNHGLMGELARASMNNNGEVIGIIPQKLHETAEHTKLTELVVVNSMHDRKAKMYEMSDGFIALPGGIGTLEELTECLTWKQIGYHQKPIGILNINGFYDKLKALFQFQIDEGFLSQELIDTLIVSEGSYDLLDKMEQNKVYTTKKMELQ